jgi:hypothetical protein
MKVKTFSSLPMPFDREFKLVYEEFKDLEINSENSKTFLLSLSKFEDQNWVTLRMIKYIVGKGFYEETFDNQDGIWSFDIGGTSIRLITLKQMLSNIYVDGDMKMRLNSLH